MVLLVNLIVISQPKLVIFITKINLNKEFINRLACFSKTTF